MTDLNFWENALRNLNKVCTFFVELCGFRAHVARALQSTLWQHIKSGHNVHLKTRRCLASAKREDWLIYMHAESDITQRSCNEIRQERQVVNLHIDINVS